MKHMPLGDVSIISASATFFTCISARIFLKEAIDKLNLINIVFVLGGLILIVQPPFIFSVENKKRDCVVRFEVGKMFASALCTYYHDGTHLWTSTFVPDVFCWVRAPAASRFSAW